ncbi:HWE histidine kinase domain-containing protein [Qipengyuania spongiae]|uniref:histidine kinase n=1 Tax=Qipengyuania spongiae TaxID=2909673 RepID=A0ABY5T0N4_9SPHN|nr:HWE histidine kinase domain-containing protein [Qipengyuania spongiae]UVI40362.1 GAF domain-containing protein [Qipengyuania spongiae]
MTIERRYDLTNCDREPIHELGHIQDFGALIALTGDWLVAHRSANFSRIAGLDSNPESGTPLDTLLLPEAATRIRQSVSRLVENDDVERIFDLALFDHDQTFDCAIHGSGPYTILEIEPHRQDFQGAQLRMMQPVMRKLDDALTIEEQGHIAAEELQKILGFDRVMLYRFQSDGSGDVIAEAKTDVLESFLHLRYPHTDIPRQARALYLRNRFRIISDVNAEPVPIEPGVSMDGEPIDLSMSTLRAVSPIHIEYLRNMGVGASLSISVIVDGKLWGLFACHHYSAKMLSYPLRTGAELFSALFSLVVERTLKQTQANFQRVGQNLHDKLMRAVMGGETLVESLPELRPIIQRAIPNDGASVFVDGVYEARGTGPSEEQFRALVPMLNSAASSRVIAIENLAEKFPQSDAFPGAAAGALIIPISRSPRDYFILWRRELKQQVTWAGNPTKPVEPGPNGDRLTPRKSFEAWQQSVEGRSAEWTEMELQIAESLRVTLLEVILRITDEAVQERAKAQQQQELLIAELNHRVRNILNLIRGLINQSRHEAMDIEEFTKLVGGRISALANAHDNITRQNWSAASLSDLIDSEADAYLSGKRDRLILQGDEAMVSPEAYTVLALVLHEMITNSAKYGALCDTSGSLTIEVSCDQSGMTIEWRERGGPPVKPPERRGFGTTIIERSIPFELNGEAKLDYKLSGVEARFWIPGRYIVCGKSKRAQSPQESKVARDTDLAQSGIPERVLLVEDSMIIAMDTEECLRSLGVKDVIVEGTVATALDSLKKNAIDMAVIDYNLGSESSDRVAAELKSRGIPFWLATGYGEMEDKLEELGAKGLLVKPYGKEELKGIVTGVGKPDGD